MRRMMKTNRQNLRNGYYLETTIEKVFRPFARVHCDEINSKDEIVLIVWY